MSITREKMNYDLVIVGAGPSGLSAAINFKKLCKKEDKDFSEIFCVYLGRSRFI